MNQIKIGKCEVCETPNIPVELHYGDMPFCKACWEHELKATELNQTSRVSFPVESPISQVINSTLSEAQKIDNSIEVRSELFNAATVSIIELKQQIDADSTVTNKPYALASALKTRFEHHQSVIFELNKQLVENHNEQKAIQTYLNSLANQLRAEEREKLKIQDINYRPATVKQPTVKKVTTRQTNKKVKIDKVELRAAAKKLGIAEFNLQLMCVSQNKSVAEMTAIIKSNLTAAKLESTPQVIEPEEVSEEVVDMDGTELN